MQNTIELLQKETESLKKQQIDNLQDYSEKYRKLNADYKSLLAKKKNLEAELTEAFSVEKQKIGGMENDIKEAKAEQAKLLSDAEIIKKEAEDLKYDAKSDQSEFEIYKLKQVEAYRERTETLAKSQTEIRSLKDSLKEKLEKADNIKAMLGEEKIANKKELERIAKERQEVRAVIAQNKKVLDEIVLKVATNNDRLIEIKEIEAANKVILIEITQGRAFSAQQQDNITDREEVIIKDKKKVAEGYAEIARIKETLKKKLDEAETLYQTWKNKGGN